MDPAARHVPQLGQSRQHLAISLSVTGDNLLGVPETRLPAETEVDARIAASGSSAALKRIAASNPTSSLVWALLADATYNPSDPIESYAYARVGYHRGLDALRRAGWRGQGPIPWAHEPNRGVLRSLYALKRAAAAMGENDEVVRLTDFLRDSDPTAVGCIQAEETVRASPPTEVFVILGED